MQINLRPQLLSLPRHLFLHGAVILKASALFVLVASPVGVAAAADTDRNRDAEAFFESRVRPLLARHCQECHGPEKQESGLALTSRAAVLKGGFGGPAVVPGDTDESLLIEAVRHDGLEMPPTGRLADNEVAIFERWVRDGAVWPESLESSVPLGDQEAIFAAAEDHWAFQPVTKPAVPKVMQRHLVRNEVDAFVVARQEAAGLEPLGLADPRTLIRRLSIDLTGLPPTAAETASFVAAYRAGPHADVEPRAMSPQQRAATVRHRDNVYAELVERLLASQRYGERWARHWLDVARYADTRDFLAAGQDRRYPFAWTYRDWVIAAFNQDLPYDEFVRLQLAADAYRDDPQAADLAALGLLTVGPRFINKVDEQIADRIDVVGRGFLGLTISCARCHDHKYDPIPTADYYGLYGVFASCEEPDELPLIAGREPPANLRAAYEQARQEKLAEKRDYGEELRDQAETDLRSRIGDYFLGYYELNIAKTASIRKLLSSRKLMETAMTPLARNLDLVRRDKAWQTDPVWWPLVRLLALPESELAKAAAELGNGSASNVSDRPVDPLVAAAVAKAAPRTHRDVLAAFAGVLAAAESRWQELLKQQPAAKRLEDDSWETIRQAVYAADSPLRLEANACMSASRLLGKGRLKLADLDNAIKEVDATHPGAPPRSFVLVDRAKPVEPFIFLRGERQRRGPQVSRHFLTVLGGGNEQPFVNGSGRRELAEAIASPRNPLTARVFVNRVWTHHFGRGLVVTPSDFGLRSEPPSHPELLDWLAASFVERGWSVKELHRLIVNSRTYRLASPGPADAEVVTEMAATDPDNRLLCRANRRRLDFESMRDAMLLAAGRLDDTVGGRPVDLSAEPFSARRTIYGYIDRLNLDPMYTTFDFASPDVTAAERPTTTVPQQALFGMNHPFVIEQSRAIAARGLDEAAERGDVAVAEAMYRAVYGRTPLPAEVKTTVGYVRSLPKIADGIRGVWQYGYGDPRATPHTAARFRQLPYFDGRNYQGSAAFPDPQLFHLRLSATGGHPGRGGTAVIRRWVAPRDGSIQIRGELAHLRDRGDGVEGQILHVHSQASGAATSELIGSWKVFNDKQQTNIDSVVVRRGDAIDFVVGSAGNSSSDAFGWSPTIGIVKTGTAQPEATAAGQQWAAAQDFGPPPPPPLSPWEQVAQALLLTNEFWFLD